MSKGKRIGTAFESHVVNYLTERGVPCRRVALAGAEDEGDIRSDDHSFILECKAGKAAENASHNQLAQWLVETERERVHASVPYAFLATKVAGKGSAQAGLWNVHISAEMLNACWAANVPAGGYLTITLDTFISWWQGRPAH
jgi:hypothetical protein